jgi:HlyD family secretion protein
MKVILLFALFLTACSKKIETTKPVYKSITESVYASGSVKGNNQYTVFSSVSGIVESVYVTENEPVSIGSILFLINNDAQKINDKNANLNAVYNSNQLNYGKVQEALSQIKLAKEKLANDELMLTRYQNLFKEGNCSKIELEQKELNLKNSKTNFQSSLEKHAEIKRLVDFQAKQALINVESSREKTKNYTIKSTIDGKMYQINTKKGEMISPQIPLAIVGDKSDYILEMQVDEYDIISIQKGMKVLVVLSCYRDSVFTAYVTNIRPIMNLKTNTFTVEAKFMNQPKLLFPDISFEANIIINSKDKVLLVPRNYLLNETTVTLKSGIKRKIKTGLKDFEFIEVRSGLTSKDELILPEK